MLSIWTGLKFCCLVKSEVILTFLACQKSGQWLWKESCVSTGVRKPGKHRYITDHHDMTLAVKWC